MTSNGWHIHSRATAYQEIFAQLGNEKHDRELARKLVASYRLRKRLRKIAPYITAGAIIAACVLGLLLVRAL